MRKILSFTSFLAVMLMALIGAACAPAASTTPGDGTPTVPAIVGTWINFYYGIGSGGGTNYTNTFIFNADNSYKEITWGPSMSGTNTNSGTYTFANDVLTILQVMSGDVANPGTNKNPAIMDGNNLYSARGSVYYLVSGSGWSGVYKSHFYQFKIDHGTNIIETNYLILTSTPSNITVTDSTNFISTNGVGVYFLDPNTPTNGTVLNWTDTSSDNWHAFDMGGTAYFLNVGNCIIYSGTNILALSGAQYIKQ